MLRTLSLIGFICLSTFGMLGCGGGGSSEPQYYLPTGTAFTIFLGNPQKVSNGEVIYNYTTNQILDATSGDPLAADAIDAEMLTNQSVYGTLSLSAIFYAGELLTGTITINPEEYECVYSIDGNTESTFNLTIKWGTVFDDAEGTTPQTIRLKNCTIADKKVYGSVDTWTYNYRGLAVSGTGGMVNPL